MQEIIDHFGGKSKMAEALGVEKPSVSWWLRNGLPAFRAVQIEKITDGKFKAVDIFGVRHGTEA